MSPSRLQHWRWRKRRETVADDSVEDVESTDIKEEAKIAPGSKKGQAHEANVIKEGSQQAQNPKEKKGPEPASLLALEPEAPASSLGNLDFILDVPLQITVNLGHRKMLIKELLQLGQGSVVELEKLAGEPMDVLIGERLIARGEVVVVNEKFGVRLTDIVSTVERINQLKH